MVLFARSAPASASVEATTAPQRAGEPSWHRRARRRRGEARAWLRVAAAGRLLAAHHSAQRGYQFGDEAMPNAAARGKGPNANVIRFGKGASGFGGGSGQGEAMGKGAAWDCSSCGTMANFSWRARCRICEAPRKRDGAGGASNSATSSSSTGASRQLSLAERQLQDIKSAQKQQRRADDAEKKRLRDELARAQAELAAGRAGTKPTKQSGGKGGDDEDEDEEFDDMEVVVNEYSAWTEDERQRQVEKARAGIAYLASKYGEDSAEVQSVKDEISSLQRASREAKPYKAHRGILERRRERLRAKLERDEAEVEKIKAEQKTLQEKLDDLHSSNEEKRTQLAQVEEELAEVVRRALAEGDAAGTAGKQADSAATPWSAQSASATLLAMASRPGVPPEFAALLGHVHQAAQVLAGAEAAAAAARAAAAEPATDADRQPPHAQSSSSLQPHPPHTSAPPQSPLGANGAGGANTGGAASGSEAGSISAAGAPNGLAPQARWSRNAAAASAAGSQGAQGPATYAAAVSGETTAGQTATDGNTDATMAANGGKGGAGSAAGSAAAASATTGGVPTGGDDEELLEDDDCDGMQVDSEVAASINKLPKADQRLLRAALRTRRGERDHGQKDEQDNGGQGRDRERSPRPTKNGGGKEEA